MLRRDPYRPTLAGCSLLVCGRVFRCPVSPPIAARRLLFLWLRVFRFSRETSSDRSIHRSGEAPELAEVRRSARTVGGCSADIFERLRMRCVADLPVAAPFLGVH